MNNTSFTSTGSNQPLFDTTGKVFTKAMIEDVAVEMLRMEHRDKELSKNNEIKIPHDTYSDISNDEQHYITQLQKQRIHDMTNVTDNQFTRWDDMRVQRDERFARSERVHIIKQHQNVWPVYKYSHEKVDLKSGLVHLKSPKFQSSHQIPINNDKLKSSTWICKQHKSNLCDHSYGYNSGSGQSPSFADIQALTKQLLHQQQSQLLQHQYANSSDHYSVSKHHHNDHNDGEISALQRQNELQCIPQSNDGDANYSQLISTTANDENMSGYYSTSGKSSSSCLYDTDAPVVSDAEPIIGVTINNNVKTIASTIAISDIASKERGYDAIVGSNKLIPSSRLSSPYSNKQNPMSLLSSSYNKLNVALSSKKSMRQSNKSSSRSQTISALTSSSSATAVDMGAAVSAEGLTVMSVLGTTYFDKNTIRPLSPSIKARALLQSPPVAVTQSVLSPLPSVTFSHSSSTIMHDDDDDNDYEHKDTSNVPELSSTASKRMNTSYYIVQRKSEGFLHNKAMNKAKAQVRLLPMDADMYFQRRNNNNNNSNSNNGVYDDDDDDVNTNHSTFMNRTNPPPPPLHHHDQYHNAAMMTRSKRRGRRNNST